MRLAAIPFLALLASATLAQGIQLSPTQQQMLNSLPAAQRQQAMDAIRQLESQQSQATQSSINEDVIPTAPSANQSEIEAILASAEKVAAPRSRVVISFTPVSTLSATHLTVILPF